MSLKLQFDLFINLWKSWVNYLDQLWSFTQYILYSFILSLFYNLLFLCFFFDISEQSDMDLETDLDLDLHFLSQVYFLWETSNFLIDLLFDLETDAFGSSLRIEATFLCDFFLFFKWELFCTFIKLG
jgi:hypothetical protein